MSDEVANDQAEGQVPPSGVHPALQKAQLEITNGRLGQALAALLGGWPTLRSLEMAELIEELSSKVDLAPPEGGDEWLDVANQQSVVDIGRLLQALPGSPLEGWRAGLDALERFAPDPRIADFLASRVAKMNSSHPWKPVHNAAHRILVATNDPRTTHRLEAVLPQYSKRLPSGEAFKKSRIERTLSKLTPPVVLSDPDRASIENIKRIAAQATEFDLSLDVQQSTAQEVQLLEEIYGDPSNFEPRLVYADLLQNRGEPWGELITLQVNGEQAGGLKGAKAKRAKELIREHGESWLGPLSGVIQKRSAKFKGGFLAGCTVGFHTNTQRELIDHPMWATVTHLDTQEMALLTHPGLKCLRWATATPETLSILSQRKAPVPLESAVGPIMNNPSLRVRGGLDCEDRDAWKPALEVGALTHLRNVSLHAWTTGEHMGSGDYHADDLHAEELRWWWDSPLGRQLHCIDIYTYDQHEIARWLPIMQELPNLQRVLVRTTNCNSAAGSRNMQAILCLERCEGSFSLRLQMSWTFEDELNYYTMPEQLDSCLKGFPKPEVPMLNLEYIGSKKIDLSQYSVLADRFAGLFDAVNVPSRKAEPLGPRLAPTP